MSFEFRYGTCPLPGCPSAATTSPRELRLLLIFWASFNRVPEALVDFNRSEPARSMRLSLPFVVAPVVRLTAIIFTVNTR